MDIERKLLDGYSKQDMLEIADHIGGDGKRFNALFQLMLGEDARLSRRAAWAVSKCLEAYPSLGPPCMDGLLGMLDPERRDLHDALRRCVLRSLTFMEIPEAYHGIVADRCFSVLQDRKEAVAIQVHAMTVLHQLTKAYPDLRSELVACLEAGMSTGSAGYRSRAMKIIRNSL